MNASNQPEESLRRETIRNVIRWSALTLIMIATGVLIGAGLAILSGRPLDMAAYASAIGFGLIFGNLCAGFPIGSQLGAAFAYKDNKFTRALPAIGLAFAALLVNSGITIVLLAAQLAWQPALPFLALLVAIGAEASSVRGRFQKVLPRHKRKH